MVSVFLKIVVIATLLQASLACEPVPFPIGVDSNLVYFRAVFGRFWSFTGKPEDVISLYCTTGCSTTFHEVSINDIDVLDYVSLDSVYFLIHGYTDSIKPADQGWMNKTATDLACKANATVCMVDWNPLAIYRYDVTVNRNLQIVADYLTEFINHLRELGAQLKNITLIGHSLGAHLAGFVGKNLGARTIGRIFAIDPAGPLFLPTDETGRLARSDAIKTICLHTSPNGLGIAFSICDADFWPNHLNGSTVPNPFQPGCLRSNDCSHGRSVYLLYSSLYNKLVGTRVCQVGATDCNSEETETFGLDYGGREGEFTSNTTDCYPFILLNKINDK